LYASPLIVLVILRLLMGAIEAPAFPANSRLSVQWFPNNERGFVTSVYQAAQYISLGIITPLMTIILHNLSWHYVFYYIGAIGVVLGIFWLLKVKDPLHHPQVNKQEIDYIRDGGGEPALGSASTKQKISLSQIKSVCVNRMMIGGIARAEVSLYRERGAFAAQGQHTANFTRTAQRLIVVAPVGLQAKDIIAHLVVFAFAPGHFAERQRFTQRIDEDLDLRFGHRIVDIDPTAIKQNVIQTERPGHSLLQIMALYRANR
jgi:MFS family permease